MPRWNVVWITGASSGIGLDVAKRLVAQGSKVAISARRADTLTALAAATPGLHAFPLDVSDGAATAATVAAIEAQLGPIDLAILNAGTWDPMGASDFTAARAEASMRINYVGLAHGIEALIPRFTARQRGHLALVSSVAGYRGLPKGAAYAPSKAAVINLAEVLKPDLERHGIIVSVINPGFVKTPMTAVNEFPMPFLIESDDAAQRIVRGLERGKFEIAFPWPLVTILKIMRVLPYWLYFRITRGMLPGKS